MKYYRPRRTARKYRKYGKRRFNISRSLAVARKTSLVNIKRSFLWPENFYVVPGGWRATAYSFSLSSIASSYTEFTNLFEQYRINGVKLTFIPQVDAIDANQLNVNIGAGGGSVASVTVPRLYTAIDHDGNARTGSEQELLQYGNHRIIKNPLRTFSIYVKHPRVQVATANATTLVGGAPKSKVWLDVDNYNVQHWGAVIGGQIPFGAGTGPSITYTVICTMYMQFKDAV